MYYIDDKEFGRIYIAVRGNMRNVTMRWRGGNIYMNVPPGASRQQLENIINDLRTRLRKSLQQDILSYHLGQVIQCYGFTITINEQDQLPGKIIFSKTDTNVVVSVPQGTDLNRHHNKEWVSKALKIIAHERAARVLLPLAKSITQRLAVAPRHFEIGRGLRKLGHCTPAGVIQLSANLVFLPEELITLVVCHELAHLTHMNHSPQFHALLNAYVGGREKQLERQLKTFPWPVIK